MCAGQQQDTAAWQARSFIPTPDWELKPRPPQVWQDKLPGLDNDFRPERAISTFPMPQRAVLQARAAQEAALRPGMTFPKHHLGVTLCLSLPKEPAEILSLAWKIAPRPAVSLSSPGQDLSNHVG